MGTPEHNRLWEQNKKLERENDRLRRQLAAANERADRVEAMIFRPALGSIEIKTNPYVPEGILLCHPATLGAAHANREGK